MPIGTLYGTIDGYRTREDGSIEVIVLSPPDERYHVRQLVEDVRQEKDSALDIVVNKHRKRRSLDANAYCWVLCEQIAECIKMGKEEIYRRAIRHVGVYDTVAVMENAVESLARGWESNGIGWFALVVDGCKLERCKRVNLYYGSSTYGTQQMSRLIDWLVQDAKAMGIETATPQELARYVNEWGA